MINNDLLRKAVQTQYTLVRLPLTVLDERVVSRYAPKGSKVQQSFSRALGALDATAQRLLTEQSTGQRTQPKTPQESRGDTQQATRQDAARDTSTGTGSAAAPATAPGVARTPQPDQEWPATPDEPSEGEPLPSDEQEEIVEVANELLEEQQEQNFAGELAEDEELRRVQAELHAKHLVAEAEEQAGS